MEKKISKAVIMRLPRYYRYLSELLKKGETRISSKKLSEKMGLTASQLRQDLNNFGDFGLQGYGYNIEYLKNEIAKVMGINKTNNMIMIGCGNLGKAIIKYSGFNGKGFRFTSVFDINNEAIGKSIDDIPVYSMTELDSYIENNDVDIIVLAVPKNVAQNIVSNLKASKRIGIWNFASTDLHAEENFIIENVHLSESLLRLTYKIRESENKKIKMKTKNTKL